LVRSSYEQRYPYFLFDGVLFFINRDVSFELHVEVMLLVMFGEEGRMMILGYRDVNANSSGKF